MTDKLRSECTLSARQVGMPCLDFAPTDRAKLEEARHRRQPMTALIARVESATGPSFALEQEIADLAGVEHGCRIPPYTASIDAALTLLSPDRTWTVGRCKGAPGYVAILDNDGRSHRAATPALAIVAAALKARENVDG